MSNTAKGSDIDKDTEQRSQLNMREKGGQGESRQLATLEEQEQDNLEEGGEEKEIENEEEEKERLRKIQEELDNEEKVRWARERLAEEKKEEERKERMRRIHEELEQGLNSEEKVRRARKRLAEVCMYSTCRYSTMSCVLLYGFQVGVIAVHLYSIQTVHFTCAFVGLIIFSYLFTRI